MKEIVKFIKEGLKITSKTKVVKYNYHNIIHCASSQY